MPVKDSHTRMEPLALASGHGRCMTVAPERTLFRWGMAVIYSGYKSVTVSLPKRFPNGRFTSETAARRFQK
jgi:hypothetical protein